MSDYLCDELIDEIFARLPPKSLLRFRSLSKSWCSRISSPDFIRKHAIRSAIETSHTIHVRKRLHFKKDGLVYLYRFHPEVQFMRVESAKFPSSNCHIFGSCFGIICVYKKKGRPSITLWNPSIRRKLTVPDHPYSFRAAFGFGFDPITDDYKIVGISYGPMKQFSLLYSMKTNSWSEIAIPTTITPYYLVKTHPCFVYGAMHWVVRCKSNNIRDCNILTFDLSSHVFGMISLPKPSWVKHQLVIIKDSLAVISTDGN